MPRPTRLHDNWPIPNDYLLELGRVTSLWSILESTMDVAITKFAGFTDARDARAIIMLAHANSRQRIDILGALCERLAPEYPHLRDYKAVMAQIQQAQTARNSFVHNGMSVDLETGEVLQSSVTARGKLKFSTRDVSLSALIDTSATIHEAMCALLGLTTRKTYKPMWERGE